MLWIFYLLLRQLPVVTGQLCLGKAEGAMIRDASNCSVFYICSHQDSYRQECPSKLVFNTKFGICDWPQHADCPAVLPAGGSNFLLGGYFVNWAQWRKPPYGPYTPVQLRNVAAELDLLYYAFAYFNADTFAVETVEANDAQFYQDMTALRTINSNLQSILSIGGWNFFSGTFHKMASTEQNRAQFIKSLIDFLDKYNFDGVDIDWEFPCSPSRTNYVQYSCWDVKAFNDPGGVCPDDKVNFVALVKEIREAMPTKYISIASPASTVFYNFVDLAGLALYVNHFNLMAYDFTVSAVAENSLTAPNAPLYNPNIPALGPAATWSVATAVDHYLNSGVPAKKIMLGVPLYGHHWYVPNLQGDSWAAYGLKATVQGKCCGPYQNTFGGEPGPGSQQCGTLMLSEIQDKLGSLNGPNVRYDETSGTNIGYTSDGLWISFDNETSLLKKAEYVKTKGLAGMFVFDTSMDLIENGQMTYPTIKALRAALD